MEGKILQLLIYYPVLLISLTVHEFCHGYVALKRGDNTAKLMGRLTFNPIAHIDPIGTVLFPIFSILFGGLFFGWAKPVPVNPMNFKDRRHDLFLVSFAGPLSNLVLAIFAALFFGLIVSYGHTVMDQVMRQIFLDMSQTAIYLNLALFFFNLIPVAPLDGSKIIGRFLPDRLYHYFSSINPMYGGMALLFLLMSGLLEYLAIPIYALGNYLQHLFVF